MDAIIVEDDFRIPHKLCGNITMGIGKVDNLLDDGLAGDAALVELHVESDGGGAVAVDTEGQAVEEIEETQLVGAGAHAESLDVIFLVLGEGVDHLKGVPVVGRLEGSGGLEDVVGWGCWEEFEGPVLVRRLGHGGGAKVHRNGHLGLDGSQAGVQGYVGRAVGVGGQGQKAVTVTQMVQEVGDTCN